MRDNPPSSAGDCRKCECGYPQSRQQIEQDAKRKLVGAIIVAGYAGWSKSNILDFVKKYCSEE